MIRFFTLLGLMLSLMQPSFADAQDITVEVRTVKFGGLWRFADGREGSTIGTYDCGPPHISETIGERQIDWYLGKCNTTFTSGELGLTGEVSFEIRAAHGITSVLISQTGEVRLANPNIGGPTLSFSFADGRSVLTINSVAITVEPNGYKGLCGFEYLFTKTGANFQSCGGISTYLPRGTSWNLVIGGYQLFPVFIGHDGTPFPFTFNGHISPVSRVGSRLISLSTIDVHFTPVVDVNWSLAGASTPGWDNNMTHGIQTVRLPRFGQYRVGIFPDITGPSGANFTLPDNCDSSAQTLYIPSYTGAFRIQQRCDTVRR